MVIRINKIVIIISIKKLFFQIFFSVYWLLPYSAKKELKTAFVVFEIISVEKPEF